MQLTTDLLLGFVGGQIEVQNPGERYIYRGEIEAIGVENDKLCVKLTWMAKGDGFPPRKWVKDSQLDYIASLEIYSASNIGSSNAEVGGGDRIALNSPVVGELVVLYPPDGSKLDPARVEGLELARK